MPTRSRIAWICSRSALFGKRKSRTERSRLRRPSFAADDVLHDAQVGHEGEVLVDETDAAARISRSFSDESESRRLPKVVTDPDVGRTMPLSRRSRVVLPPPLGPTIATRSPAEIEVETPSSARVVPKLTLAASSRKCAGVLSHSILVRTLRRPRARDAISGTRAPWRH